MIQIKNVDLAKSFSEISEEQFNELQNLLEEENLEELALDANFLAELEEKGCDPDIIDALEAALRDHANATVEFVKPDEDNEDEDDSGSESA